MSVSPTLRAGLPLIRPRFNFYVPCMFVMNCGQLEVIEHKYLAHGGFVLHGGPSSSFDKLSI